MSAEQQPDPITALLGMAVQMHELYTAYIEAGFTAAQAMQLLCASIQGATSGGAG